MRRVIGVFLCTLFVLVACKTKVEKPMDAAKNDAKSSSANLVSMRVKNEHETRSFEIYNSKESTAILKLPADHRFNLSAIKPKIVVSKGAKIFPASEETQDFSGGKTVQYTVTAEDGSTKVYTVSIRVLPQRQNLQVSSIKICGVLVDSNNKARVGKDVAHVVKENVEIVFVGEMTPTDFSMSVPKISLNKLGDSAKVKFSTTANDAWNAWISEDIEIIRDGSEKARSNEKKILTFKIGKAEAIINHNSNTIVCVVPFETDLKTVAPVLTCSEGAFVTPKSGEVVDLSTSKTTPFKYKVQSESGESTFYNVRVSKGKSNLAKIISLRVGNDVAEIDETARKIVLEVERTKDLASLEPTIQVSENANYRPRGPRDFRNSVNSPVKYTVIAENGRTTRVYDVVIKYKKSKEAQITKFEVTDAKNVKNEANIVEGTAEEVGTIICKVHPETDLTNIKPIITISEKATILPENNTTTDFSKGAVEYVVTAEDGKTKKKYNVSIVKKSNVARISDFRVGGDIGVIDENKTPKTIKVEVPKGTALTNLRPTIVVADGGSVNPANNEEQNFSSPVDYVVTAEDGTTQETYRVIITHKKSSEAEILQFTALGINAKFYNKVSPEKIVVYVDYGTHVGNSIIPTIRISDNATISPHYTAAQDFSDGKTVEYTVTAEDGKTKKKYLAQILKNPPDSNVEVHNIPAVLESNQMFQGEVMTVRFTDKKETIEKSDLRVFYKISPDPTEHNIALDKLSLNIMENGKFKKVEKVNLKEHGETVFYIHLDFGEGYNPHARMSIVAINP